MYKPLSHLHVLWNLMRESYLVWIRNMLLHLNKTTKPNIASLCFQMRFSVLILQTQEVERFGKNTLIYSEYKPWACEDLCLTSSHAFLFLNYTVLPLMSLWRRQYPSGFSGANRSNTSWAANWIFIDVIIFSNTLICKANLNLFLQKIICCI